MILSFGIASCRFSIVQTTEAILLLTFVDVYANMKNVLIFSGSNVPARDGQRFLVNTQTGDPAPNPITVVLNWTAGLKK